MIKPAIIATCVLVGASSFAAITAATAETSTVTHDVAEAKALLSAKLTAVDAIKAAQSIQPGKVGEVQFDAEEGNSLFDVTIIAQDGSEHKVYVDASTGKTMQIPEDSDYDGDDD
ncbi:PepSY domain-containing protein [Hoeflea sp.]|uniref:PepSY domain-containing protein n=1 Tax=Hoeflea sp. TaxID=1940281 RepID=UPI003B5234B9